MVSAAFQIHQHSSRCQNYFAARRSRRTTWSSKIPGWGDAAGMLFKVWILCRRNTWGYGTQTILLRSLIVRLCNLLGFVFGSTKSILKTFKTSEKGGMNILEDKVSIKIDKGAVHHLRLNADERQIIVAIEGGHVLIYDAKDVFQQVFLFKLHFDDII